MYRCTQMSGLDNSACRLPYHNIAIVYCNDRIICVAVVLVVAIHEYCNTLQYIIFSGLDAGISGLVGIFPFAFAIKMTSCWDLSVSASIFNIPIPGPLQYASISPLCRFYHSLSGFICAHDDCHWEGREEAPFPEGENAKLPLLMGVHLEEGMANKVVVMQL
jgi:hypothetical protein